MTAATRVLVAGEALIDLRPSGAGDLRPCPGGGPYNTAIALARLGVPTSFHGRLSTDPFGRLLAGRLDESGVVVTCDRGRHPTPLAVVTLGSGGEENEYAFYVDGTTAADLPPGELPSLTEVAAVHIGTVALALEPAATSLELLARRAGPDRVVMLDPNVRPALVADARTYRARIERLARLADIVKLSDADAAWLAPGESPAELAARWLGDGAGMVVATGGARGAEAWGAFGHVRVPGAPVTVVDTVGAGDAFGAGMLGALALRGRLRPSSVRSLSAVDATAVLQYATAVAALTCTRAGADPPWRTDVVKCGALDRVTGRWASSPGAGPGGRASAAHGNVVAADGARTRRPSKS